MSAPPNYTGALLSAGSSIACTSESSSSSQPADLLTELGRHECRLSDLCHTWQQRWNNTDQDLWDEQLELLGAREEPLAAQYCKKFESDLQAMYSAPSVCYFVLRP
jgi:hypothetical protein